MTTAAAAPATARPEWWPAYPVLYAMAVYLLGYVPDLPWWGLAGIGGAAAVAGWFAARAAFHTADYGRVFSRSASWCAALAGVGAAGWLAVAAPLPPEQLPDALPWLLLWLAVFGGWFTVLIWEAPQAKLRRDALYLAPPAPGEPLGPETNPKVAAYQAALVEAGCDDVTVLAVTPSPSGRIESVLLMPRRVAGKAKPVTRTAFAARLPSVAQALAIDLAPRGIDLDEEHLAVERGKNASQWLLHVTIESLPRSTAFVPSQGPVPWCGPKRIGLYDDDQPLLLELCHADEGGAHGEILMATGGGKTNLLNVIIARHLPSDEGEVWLGGTNKLIKVALPWLMPWLTGRTDRPVIDRVAGESQEEFLAMLADAYQYAVLCNSATPGNDARKPTRGRGALLLIIDEASHPLKRNDVAIRCHDNVKRNASQLLAEIQRIGRTGPVHVLKAYQDGLYESLGDEGGQQRRNSKVGIVGQVQSPHDAQTVIPKLLHVNAARLEDHGIFMQHAYGPSRELRAVPDRITDADIDAVAVANVAFRCGLVPELAAKLRYYARRWDVDRQPDLVAEAQARNLTWPGPGSAPDIERAAEPEEETAMSSPDPAPQPEDDQVAERVAAELPRGWDAPDADLWAMFEQAGPAAAAAPAPETSRTPLSAEDQELVAGVQKMAAYARRMSEEAPQVDDPMGTVLYMLAAPEAQGVEFVSTRQLAILCGRISREDDEETQRRATEKLGMDINRQTGLTSVRLGKPIDPDRPKGYAVADLWEAGRRLAG